MSRSGFALASALALALAAAAPPARGQIFQTAPGGAGAQNIEGFTVTGKGSVKARPNRFEIDLDVSAASELSADAIVKYRDSKKRLTDAFTNLKLDNVAVVEEGLLVDHKNAMQNPYYYNYGQAPSTKTEVQLSRRLVVKCSKIREMEEEAVVQLVARLLDVAQDAGGQVGATSMNMPYYYYYNYGGMPQTGLVRFVLDDFDAQQDKAYEEAVADARKRAERLAKLSGVELGPVVAIREVSVPGENSEAQSTAIGSQPQGDEAESKRLISSKYEEIPIRVELLVRFDVHPKATSGDKAGGR